MFRCSAQNFLGVGEAPAGEAGAPADGYAHAHIPAPKPARAVWFSSVHFGHHFHPFLGQFFLALKQKRPVSFVRGCVLCFPPYIPPPGRNIFLKNCVSRFAGPFPRCRFSPKDPPIPRGGGAASLWLLRLTENRSRLRFDRLKSATGCGFAQGTAKTQPSPALFSPWSPACVHDTRKGSPSQ